MNSTQSRAQQSFVNLVALGVTLVLNTLATTLPLGGRTTAEISDSFNSLFVPAGYVFSIWGLIYLALIAFAIFQALPARQQDRWVRATGWWFALSCLANSLWIVFWHYGYYPATLAVMLVLLASLIVIFRRLAALGRPTRAQRWFVQFPFSLYLGWITIATVANASAVLIYLGWDGRPLTPVLWTAALIFIAAALAIVMLWRHRDLTYAAVVVWAIIGILGKQSAYPAIVAAAWLAITLIVVGALALGWRTASPLLKAAQ
jgi:hypothetical protein